MTVWDENDYSFVPNLNQVLVVVDTNYGATARRAEVLFPLLLTKTLEAGFGLPCLNHACDEGVHTMSDLFGEDRD